MTPLPPPTSSQSNPRLLTVLRLQLRLGHYSLRTEQAYVSWVRRVVRFHRCRHPRDLGRSEIRVQRGKGQKDRVTMVPEAAREPLRDHLERVRARHEADLAAGAGAVVLPEALARKYPGAIHSWGWQWVFPATRQYAD